LTKLSAFSPPPCGDFSLA